MYRTYNARPIPRPLKPRRSSKSLWVLILLIVLTSAYAAYALLRPVSALRTTILPPVVPAKVKVDIPWPSTGQAAFGADGYGYLASSASSSSEQKPSPMASVTKTITALSILEKKPLKASETGPDITFSAKDIEIYNQYIAKDGAAVPVAEGQSITQYQALQAMMLPSANNIADTAAIWAFGSLEAYTAYANNLVKRLGMSQTTVTDASGFSPRTVSTPRDLVRLGDFALDNPVLSEIVAQKQAIFPNFGTIENVNNLLGTSGIRGIKTGNTEEAGGCFLAAADITVAGKKITVITAVMGSASRPQAMKETLPIIQAAAQQFSTVRLVRAGQSVGRVSSPWGANSDVISAKSISVIAWSGTALAPKATARPLTAPTNARSPAGSLSLSYGGQTYSSELSTETAISEPTIWWRLTHPW